ncbi:MAG: DNA polymerase III subunit epsilon [Caulobacteraceae bacterium]
MTREIVLDTETTGLDPRQGHRIVEIACVELGDCLPTGRRFHAYVDPEREVDVDAERIHGLSGAFLRGKPRFADPEVVEEFLAFIGDAPIIAHNAAFDRAFVESELARAGRPSPSAARWTDTLQLAQRRFPGMYNSLDALCKRFKLSLAGREKHGALVDAQLLASVYLELRGGRERRLDLGRPQHPSLPHAAAAGGAHRPRPFPLASVLSEADIEVHALFVRERLGPQAIWLRPPYLVVEEPAAPSGCERAN